MLRLTIRKKLPVPMDFADWSGSRIGSVLQMPDGVGSHDRERLSSAPSPSASLGLDCAFLWKNGRLNCEFSLASSLNNNNFFFLSKFSRDFNKFPFCGMSCTAICPPNPTPSSIHSAPSSHPLPSISPYPIFPAHNQCFKPFS